MMSLPDDDMDRLLAIWNAARDGDLALIDVLLAEAVSAGFDVQVAGGMAERWDNTADAAAHALAAILTRAGAGVDERIRTACLDLRHDDARIGTLLYHLGSLSSSLRRELWASDEPRHRLRALAAVRPSERSAELVREALADASPLVRLEALAGGSPVTSAEALRDPDPRVRLRAVTRLRPSGDALIAAARAETDPTVREKYVGLLTNHPPTGATRQILVAYLATDTGFAARVAASLLTSVDDAGVGAAIAARILVDHQPQTLQRLLRYEHLLHYAPELGTPLSHLRKVTADDALRAQLEELPAGADSTVDPVDGLDAVQQGRLLREVLGWAYHALGPEADGSGLAAWLAAPDDRTAGEWITDHDWYGSGAAAALLRAAVDGDVRRAMAVDITPLLRLAYLFTARQIRAGYDPLPPGSLSPMLTRGPEDLRLSFALRAPVVLALHESAPIGNTFGPQAASVFVPCRECGAETRLSGGVEFLYRDDDRVRESEDGFRAVLSGACGTCETEIRQEIRLSVTAPRFHPDSRHISWDTTTELSNYQ